MERNLTIDYLPSRVQFLLALLLWVKNIFSYHTFYKSWKYNAEKILKNSEENGNSKAFSQHLKLSSKFKLSFIQSLI